MVVNAKKMRQTISSTGPILPSTPGSPPAKAAMVTLTPSRPASGFHAPVMTMARPVIVQTTRVSRKVPVMETRPWRTGSLVLAAAAAMGAEPRPASLEKMPRAIPCCMATSILPAMPPATACGLKAPTTMSANACGMAVTLAPRMMRQMRTYRMTMKGTTISDTFAMRLTPPSSTSATAAATSSPPMTTAMLYSPPNRVTVGAPSNTLFTAPVMELTCEKVPMPNSPTHMPSTAKMTARNFQRLPSPFSI